MKNKLKITFAIVFVLFVVFSFTSAKAATVPDLDLQIQNLLSQVEQLKAQIQEQSSSKNWCHMFKSPLWYGNSGDSVEALQKVLKMEGLYSNETTEKFDYITASAVTRFQEKYKKEVLDPWNLEHGTGYVGKTTRDKMNDLYGCGRSDNKNSNSNKTEVEVVKNNPESSNKNELKYESVTKQGKSFLFLQKNDQEIIVHEGYTHDTVLNNNDKYSVGQIAQAGDVRFSPKKNYLVYNVVGWEGEKKNVYDIRNEDHVLSVYGGGVAFEFTPKEDYFYACSMIGVLSSRIGKVYSVPEFEEKYNVLENRSKNESVLKCNYDAQKEAISFVLGKGDKPLELTESLKRVEYFLKEERVEENFVNENDNYSNDVNVVGDVSVYKASCGSVATGAYGKVKSKPTSNLCKEGTPSSVSFSEKVAPHYRWYCTPKGGSIEDRIQCNAYTD